jgi:hypothetical protein
MSATVTFSNFTAPNSPGGFYGVGNVTVSDPSDHVYTRDGKKVSIFKPVDIVLVVAPYSPVELIFLSADVDTNGTKNFTQRGKAGLNSFKFNAAKISTPSNGTNPTWKLFAVVQDATGQRLIIDPDFENTDQPVFVPKGGPKGENDQGAKR